MTRVTHSALQEIEELTSSPEGQIRAFGLIRLESYLEELLYEDINRILGRAVKDGDRSVVEQARRVQAIWSARGSARYGAESRWSIFRTFDSHALKRFDRLKNADIEKIRGAAYDLLTPLAVKLHAEAFHKNDRLPVDRMIDTFARLQLPQSLPVLTHLAKDAFLVERIVSALASYQTPEAEDGLLAIAEDTGSPACLKATEELGRTNNPRVSGYLEKRVKDVDPRRRKAAAFALGHHADPKSPEWLLSTLTDSNEEVVLTGLQALARLRASRAADHLVKLGKNSESRKIRATIAASLARIQSVATFDYLQSLLEDSDPRVKANAIESLSFYQLTQEQASRIFVLGLRSEIPRIRGNSVLGLFKYRPTQALESLTLMFKSPDRMMRRAAAFCAGQIQTPDTAHWVTTLVLTEQNSEVLKAGMNALQKFSRRESVEIFLRMINHPKPEIRILAMQILGMVGSGAQIVPLTSLFRRENSPKVRAAIVTALSKLGGTSMLSILPTYLNDADDRVVANAVEGLHNANNIEAVTHLKPMIHHRNRRVRANVIVSLFSLGEIKVVAELMQLLEAKDQKDQISGLWALGAIGESLRLGTLDERFLMTMALTDHYRKVPDSASLSGNRLLEAMMELRPGLVPRPLSEPDKSDIPSSESESEATDSVASLWASELPKTLKDLHGQQPSGELSQGMSEEETPSATESTQKEEGSPLPRFASERSSSKIIVLPTEEQFLIWEKFIDLSNRDPNLASEGLLHFTEEFPEDEIALFLYLRVLKDSESPALKEVVREAVGRAKDFFALLYFLARELKEQQEMSLSLGLYLQVFRSQYTELEAVARIAQETGCSENPRLAMDVLKQLSSFSGLIQDLDQELGSLYLTERFLEHAFHHLYRARVLDPSNTHVGLKLAFICRKLSHFRLGRVICKSMLNALPDDHPDYERTIRILRDLKSQEESVQRGDDTSEEPN